jgi:hypothetical protein
MTIALAKDVEEFLQEQVRAGVAGDPSELANDVLRCVRDQQRRPFEITPQLEAWLLESADQPATPLTKADFDGIRQRALERNPASKAERPQRRTISCFIGGDVVMRRTMRGQRDLPRRLLEAPGAE